MFAKTHEWVRVDGNSATIGISNYAQVSWLSSLGFGHCVITHMYIRMYAN